MNNVLATNFIDPLIARMLISNRLLDPTLSLPMIRDRWDKFPPPKVHPLCAQDEATCLQSQIAASVHKTAMQILNRESGSRKGVMYADTYAKEFGLRDLIEAYDKFCSKSFEVHESHYQLKKGITPLNALEDFLEGPTVADCGLTMDSIYFKAMADVIGEEKFNALFSLPELHFRLSAFGVHAKESLFPVFTKSVCTQFDLKNSKQPPVGSRTYIHGVPWYRAKHPIGNWIGHHTVCLGHTKTGEPLFWGLGLKSFKTEKQIVKMLLQDYNSPQSPKTVEWIDRFNGHFPKLIIQDAQLERFSSQAQACCKNPNQHLPLKKVKEHMGFLRDPSIVALSPDILSFVKNIPTNQIKDCLPDLVNLQTTLITKEMADGLGLPQPNNPQDMITIFNHAIARTYSLQKEALFKDQS